MAGKRSADATAIYDKNLAFSSLWLAWLRAELISTINLNQIASMSQYWLGLTERAVQYFRFCGFCHWVFPICKRLATELLICKRLAHFWQLIRETCPSFSVAFPVFHFLEFQFFFQKQNAEVLRCINRKFYRIRAGFLPFVIILKYYIFFLHITVSQYFITSDNYLSWTNSTGFLKYLLKTIQISGSPKACTVHQCLVYTRSRHMEKTPPQK